MADRYWVGGAGIWNTTSTTNWSISPGGAGGASVPTAADSVFFDSGSGTPGTITCTGALNCLDFTVSVSGWTFSQTSATLSCAGNFSIASGSAWSVGNTLTFTATSSKTITMNGTTTSANIVFNGAGGSWSLNSAFITTGSITVSNGTFTTNNYAVTATQIISVASATRVMNFGSSVITLSGTAAFNLVGSIAGLTINAGTSTLNITGASAQVTTGSQLTPAFTLYNVNYTNTSTNSLHILSGGFTVNNLSVAAPIAVGVNTLQFQTPVTINGTLSTTGTAGNRRVIFRGATYGVAQTLTINSAPSLTDADFRDMYVIGTAAPISGTRIGDLRGIRGITTDAPKTVYWNLATGGNWSANAWATSSGGTVSTDNFPLAQDTAVIVNTGLNTSATVTLDAAVPYTGTVDMSARTSAMTLAGSTSYTIYGDWKNGSGTTLSATGSLVFSGRNAQSITPAGRSFTSSVNIDSYGGTVQLTGALNLVSNTLTVTNGTFDTASYTITAGLLSSNNTNVRTIFLRGSTLTLSGTTAVDFSNSTNLTFNAGTSTINFNALSGTINAPGVTFYDVVFTGTGQGRKTFTGNTTYNNLTLGRQSSGTSPGLFMFVGTHTITGTFSTTSTADATRCITITSGNPVLTIATISAAVATVSNAVFAGITFTGSAAPVSGTNVGDGGRNSGINFSSPRTLYWNNSAVTNYYNTGWTNTSGGTPSTNFFPLPQDTIVIDNSSAITSLSITTQNANTNAFIGTIDVSARTIAATLSLSGNTTAYSLGNYVAGSGVTESGGITFIAPSTSTITSNGHTITLSITVNALEGTVQLADALVIGPTDTLTVSTGTFDAVSYNVTAGLVNFAATASTLKMGSGTWTVTGTGAVWTGGTGTFYKGTANIVLSDTSTTARTFAGGGLSYNKLTIGGTTGLSTTTITGNNQFTELASTKTVAHTIALVTTTQTFGAWTVTGTAGNVVTVTGTGVSHVIAGARVSGVDYLAMGTIGFSTTSPGEFYAGPNSTGTGAGVILTAAPTPVTRYWVGGTGNWTTTTTNWSDTSGGAGGFSVPTSVDAVIFNSASSATAYTVNISTVARCGTLTMAGPASGQLNIGTVAGVPLIIHDNTTFASTGVVSTNMAGGIVLSGSSAGKTFTTNGVALTANTDVIQINGVGCEWTLGSATNLGTNAGLNVVNGSFLTANYSLTCAYITSSSQHKRSINLGSSLVSMTGFNSVLGFGTTESIRADLTFNAGTSTLSIGTTTPTFSANNQTFYNVSFTSTTSGSAVINGANTFNNLSFTGTNSPGVRNYSISANQVVNGTFTISPGTNASCRIGVRSDTLGTTRTISVNSFGSSADADFRDIAITGAAAPISGTRFGDCKGNSGITFSAPKTVYRVNTGGSTLNTSSAWSNVSGGSPSYLYFPLAQDTAIFDNNSYTGFQTNAVPVGTLDFTNRTTAMPITLVSGDHHGDLLLSSACTTNTQSSTITFAGRTTQYIRSAGVVIRCPFDINSPGGSVVLSDAINLGDATYGILSVTQGTLDANGYNVTVAVRFTSTNTNTRTIAVGSGTWTVLGSSTTAWSTSTSTNLTVTGTGVISMNGATAKTFVGGGVSYSGVTLNQGGAGTLTITGNNAFADISNTYKATGATNITLGSTTQRVGNFTASGEAGRVLLVQGTSASSPATLIFTGSGVASNVDYLNIIGVRAYGLTDTWYAGTNSINNGSLGWYFSSGSAPTSDVYYGSINITSLYYGSVPVSAVYYGPTLIFSASP